MLIIVVIKADLVEGVENIAKNVASILVDSLKHFLNTYMLY